MAPAVLRGRGLLARAMLAVTPIHQQHWINRTVSGVSRLNLWQKFSLGFELWTFFFTYKGFFFPIFFFRDLIPRPPLGSNLLRNEVNYNLCVLSLLAFLLVWMCKEEKKKVCGVQELSRSFALVPLIKKKKKKVTLIPVAKGKKKRVRRHLTGLL